MKPRRSGYQTWDRRVHQWIVGLFRDPVCLDGQWERYCGPLRGLREGDWYTSVVGTEYEIRDGYWQLRKP